MLAPAPALVGPGGLLLGAERWNFILPTKQGLETPKRELLLSSVTVVVNGAIEWCKGHHADVWAMDNVVTKINKFPPGLAVWGPLRSAAAFRVRAIPFHPLQPNMVIGPGEVPREADAFFLALAYALEHLRAKQVRVFGAFGWQRADVRWKRYALAKLMRKAGEQGIEIERVR